MSVLNPERESWYWSHKVLQSHPGVHRLEGRGWFAVKVGKRGSPLPSQRRKSSFTSRRSNSAIRASFLQLLSPVQETTLCLKYPYPSTNSTFFSATFPGALEEDRISGSDAITSHVSHLHRLNFPASQVLHLQLGMIIA